MLDAIGAADIEELFDAVPAALRLDRPLEVPQALSEIELIDHLATLSAKSQGARDLVCFAGGGAYDHYVPAAARSLAVRAEFATSYTPYQPELSQGVLQAVFEFQTMVCELFGLDVANASLYDGASSLVEAVNLAVRVTKRERVVVGGGVNPQFVQVLRTSTAGLGLEIEVAPVGDNGITEWNAADGEGAAALVVASPNFFGRVEEITDVTRIAADAGALSVVIADPTSLGILEAPGHLGADIAIAEGAAVGNAMSYGGPYVGLFATKIDHIRQVPGRIAGETLDARGRRAYVLTLQAREQHIRRARATSNVCTNQTLMAIAFAIHMSWLGPQGLARLGEICLRRTAFAAGRLSEIPGCRIRFAGPSFKEVVLETPIPAATLVAALARRGFLAGPDLGRWYPELENCLLVAVTERRTEDDVLALAEAIEKELTEQ